jgi:putative OPT family oligopeptide transporter
MIGATPWRQQVMLAEGAISCALIMAPMLNLLASAYGIGAPTPEQPKALAAPQATLMASVAKGLFGGELPWDMVWLGVGVGALIIAADEILKRRGAKFRIPVLGAAVGIYLPLDTTVPIFLGGLLAHLVERAQRATAGAVDEERLHRRGVLYSAGLITGEALMGIVIAVPIVVSKRDDVLAIPEKLQLPATAAEVFGLAAFALVGYLLYRSARSGANEVENKPAISGAPSQTSASS